MKRFPFLSVIIAAAVLAAIVLFLERAERGTPYGTVSPLPATPQKARGEAPGKAIPPKRPAREEAEPAAPAAVQPGRTVAILIDDIGFDLRVVQELAGLPAPIAFAVLPHTPYAAEAARFLHAAGREVLLHLPMEPRSHLGGKAGAGTLLVDMDERQIRRQVMENLASVPHVSGANNHMGSRFMEDEERLTTVMEELAKRSLYFIDSRTTADSRGRQTAKRADVRYAARDLFIDHSPGYAAAMESLIGASRKRGENGKPLLMIGHPHPDTVRALRDALSRWREEGVGLAALPTLLRTPEKENRNAHTASGQTAGRKETVR